MLPVLSGANGSKVSMDNSALSSKYPLPYPPRLLLRIALASIVETKPGSRRVKSIIMKEEYGISKNAANTCNLRGSGGQKIT